VPGFVAEVGGALLAGCVAYGVFLAARALVARLARVPGRLGPFSEAPRAALARRSVFLRLALTAAGPVAAYLFATTLSAIGLHGTGVFDESSTRVEVAAGGAAEEAGLRDGDRIVAVAGVPATRFADLPPLLAAHAGERVELRVDRDGREVSLAVRPGPVGSPMQGKIGVHQALDPVTVTGAFKAALRRPIALIAARVAAAGPRVVPLSGPIGITRAIDRAPQPSTATLIANVVGFFLTISLEIFLLLSLFLFPFRRAGASADGHDPLAPGRPWTRLVARTIDLAILLVALAAVLAAVNPALPDIVGPSLISLSIPIEAALLASWGTTPGKALLGIAVRDAGGGKLRFGQALRRTAAVWTFGLGTTQLIGFVTGGLAFRRLRRQGATYWDALDDLRVEHRDVSGLRTSVAVAIVGLIALAVLATILKRA